MSRKNYNKNIFSGGFLVLEVFLVTLTHPSPKYINQLKIMLYDHLDFLVFLKFS